MCVCVGVCVCVLFVVLCCVVVFLWRRLSGGVCVVVFLCLCDGVFCFCGGVLLHRITEKLCKER